MEGAVQPQEGAPEGAPQQEQGQGAPETPGLYQEVLEGVPNEYHESLIERLKEMDGKATQRFQSQAEKVKPYEEAGILDADPEVLSGYLNLAQALDGAVSGDQEATQAVEQWWGELGEQLGFFEEGQEGTGEQQQQAAQDLLDLTPQDLQQMVSEKTAEAINPLLERFEQQEQEQLVNEAKQELQDSLSKLRAEHQNLTDDDEKYILALAWQFGQDADDPLAAGFQEFPRLVSRGEANLFESKVNTPQAPEGGGVPNTAAPVPNSENAKQLATERLQQLTQTP
jgi:hypothetical protein